MDVLLEDESLRDGLQFDRQMLPLKEKYRLFSLLLAAGVRRVQVGSFVYPAVGPQMADTDRLIVHIRHQGTGVLLTGLVLNEKGLQRASACGLDHVSLSASASDAHSRKNVKATSQQALSRACRLIDSAKAAGMTIRVGIQCAYGGL